MRCSEWLVRERRGDLPEYYGSWNSVYTRFRRWEKAGLFEQILEQLAVEPDNESVMIERHHCLCVPARCGGKRGQQFQAIGRSRGGLTSKIHAVVDALGNPLKYEVTAGNINDCIVGYEMLQDIDLQGKKRPR